MSRRKGSSRRRLKMSKSRINAIAFILLAVLMTCVSVLADPAYLTEKVDTDMKRKVALNLKAEPNAKKYIVEIHPARGAVLKYEQATPQWQEYLARGRYRFRFKISFADETDSNWSEFSSFVVEDYKVSLTNVEDNVLGITKDVQNKKKAFLQWSPISDAASYALSVYQTERFEINPLSATRDIKRSKMFGEKPEQVLADLKTAEAEVKGLESGSYILKVVARNAQNKIISVNLMALEVYEHEKLSPRVITPANTFVREISWDKVIGARKYAIAVYQKNVDPLEMQKFSSQSFADTTFRIPSSWSGGQYTFCVKSHIKAKLYSADSCIDFSIKEGDRTLTAENKFYRDIVKAKSRQYYHNFNLIASSIEYKSEFPSLSSIVDISGQVLNFSYTKNDPGFSESLNQYYKLNLGYFKLPSKSELIYDFRLGQEYSNYNSYPKTIKLNAGLGLDRVIQATTDARSATQLNIYSQQLLNVFVSASFQYNYLAQYAVDFRVGYLKPVYQLKKSQDQSLIHGQTIDYSINTLINREGSNDRFEIGYLFKSSDYEFKGSNSLRTNSVFQSGHYINVGYVMEAL